MKTIVTNQIECIKCGDRPYSAHVHDFKYCKCMNVAVDGGTSYLRRIGNHSDYKELSISVDTESLDRIIAYAQEMQDSGRNIRGVVYGVLRQLRDEGLLNGMV